MKEFEDDAVDTHVPTDTMTEGTSLDRVTIFDTTLRDGEQSPGATLDTPDKLEIAHQLARLGVDVIEAGFPAASPGDLEAVRQIADAVGSETGPTICGLARCVASDIDAAWQAIQPAAKKRIHTFLATSDIHLKHKLKMTRDQVLQRTADMVAYACELCPDVEFSPEDATRSDVDFLVDVLTVAVEAGAKTFNIPDTVGYIQPEEYFQLIKTLIERVPGLADRVVSVHCHDDLGQAVANTIAGLTAGARQAECTINGLGERAGNCALEELQMALQTRHDRYNLHTNIDSRQLTRISRLVSARTGIVVPPNKAIVGANAFSHESGIHQDGVLKHQQTYEIMTPESVGLTQSKLVMGKHSGRHALKNRLIELGFDEITGDELDRVFARFKRLADFRKEVTDADLEALVADEFYQPPAVFGLDSLHVSTGLPSVPTATVSISRPEGSVEAHAATGDGPVDAIFSAINSAVALNVKLEEYSVHAVGQGVTALGEVTVRVKSLDDPRFIASGHGADTDTLVASAKAYLAALNKLAHRLNEPVAQKVTSSNARTDNASSPATKALARTRPQTEEVH